MSQMKLAISNIAWSAEQDFEIYELMKKYDFGGLEIAPTRILPNPAYEQLLSAAKWKADIWEKYGFEIPSMQSIWFGRQEKLFEDVEQRNTLLQYTKKAIDFAKTIECKNLVFGCPKNRALPNGQTSDTTALADVFFKAIGEYAFLNNTVIGMEANPPIYQTNYINTTKEALELVKSVDSKGFLLNLDVGTMIENGEPVEILENNVQYINHIHISEPGLKYISKRTLHQELAEFLKESNYKGYVSIEMQRQDSVQAVAEAMEYVKETF